MKEESNATKNDAVDLYEHFMYGFIVSSIKGQFLNSCPIY
jgi:hypothetical protein